jgi:hypothetical protein
MIVAERCHVIRSGDILDKFQGWLRNARAAGECLEHYVCNGYDGGELLQ